MSLYVDVGIVTLSNTPTNDKLSTPALYLKISDGTLVSDVQPANVELKDADPTDVLYLNRFAGMVVRPVQLLKVA
jgi:hypothetical protein